MTDLAVASRLRQFNEAEKWYLAAWNAAQAAERERLAAEEALGKVLTWNGWGVGHPSSGFPSERHIECDGIVYRIQSSDGGGRVAITRIKIER